MLHRGVWASHRGGVSCHRAQNLGLAGFSQCSYRDLEHRRSVVVAEGMNELLDCIWDRPRSGLGTVSHTLDA